MSDNRPTDGGPVALILDRVRALHRVLGLDGEVSAEGANALLDRYRYLPGGADSGKADVGDVSRASEVRFPDSPAASMVAGYIDEIITAVLVERSTLCAPASQRIRLITSPDKIADILRLRSQIGIQEIHIGPEPADSAVAKSPNPFRLVRNTAAIRCSFQSRAQKFARGEIGEAEAADIRGHLPGCAYCTHLVGLEILADEVVFVRGHFEAADDLREKTIPRILELNPARAEGSAPGQGMSRDETRRRALSGARRVHLSSADDQKVLILGGDGFCGWPTSLYLSDRGWDVTILDDLSRRKIDVDLEVQSLTPIRPMGERIRAWKAVTGKHIRFVLLDLANEYERLVSVLQEIQPKAIVHFAEQRAAPYSMRAPGTKRYTMDNNVRATHNLLTALVSTDLDASLVHLGTMGVYGYGWSGNAPIPEGYLTVKVPTPAGDIDREILHPADPISVYHLTKTLDQLMFAFYAANDGLRITDLHQGIVWGTQTDQTRRDERLINRFDYDGDYGTVLNRFLMQAAIGHPLTVHGSGFQTRAFIHIQDTVRCIELALAHPPEAGSRPKVLNQVTETFRVLDLAKMIADMMGTDIAYLPNPRCEPDENDLFVLNNQFLALGLQPTTLSEGLLTESTDVATRYRDRVDLTKIVSRSVWRVGMETADDLLAELPVL